MLFVDETKSSKSKRTLGQNVGELERFSFPDKDGILNCLRKIAEARNNMLHQFARSDADGLKKIISQDVFFIRQETEELVQKIGVVYSGLSKFLNPQAEIPTYNEVAETPVERSV